MHRTKSVSSVLSSAIRSVGGVAIATALLAAAACQLQTSHSALEVRHPANADARPAPVREIGSVFGLKPGETVEPAITQPAPAPDADSEFGVEPQPTEMPAATQPADTSAKPLYTCPMHAQIRQPEPGKCPICRMTLKPAPASHGEAQP